MDRKQEFNENHLAHTSKSVEGLWIWGRGHDMESLVSVGTSGQSNRG